MNHNINNLKQKGDFADCLIQKCLEKGGETFRIQ